MDLLLGMVTTTSVMALIATAIYLVVLAYHSTGAPAARYELLRVTNREIQGVHGGLVSTPGIRTGQWRSWGRSPNPFRSKSTSGSVPWALRTSKLLEKSQGDEYRYGMDRAIASTDLRELRRAFKTQDRRRLRSVVLSPLHHVDPRVIGPVLGKGLDFIGRGTAAGLLVSAVGFQNRDHFEVFLQSTGVFTVLGGTLGAISFLGLLVTRLPVMQPSHGQRPSFAERFRMRHPFITAALFPWVLALLYMGIFHLGETLFTVLPAAHH